MSDIVISSLFKITPRYIRSTNLERDFRDRKALENYVLTPHAQNCLSRLAHGLHPTSTQRAWRLTGNYGSGKSSFALFLANWFNGQAIQLSRYLETDVSYNRFSIRSRPTYLPLLVTGSREPMGKAILRSLDILLSEQYSRGARSDILLRTKAALSHKRVSDTEVLELIQAANEKLIKDRKGSGLLILIDELGKFLEYAASHPESQDVYLLQRLAEVAATSGQTRPLFVIGILHQGFDAYAENLDPTAQREWEKIAGRFEEVLFNQPLIQTASLIAAALRVRTVEIPNYARKEAANGLDAALRLGWFGRNLPKQGLSNLATEIYPLHGTVVPALVRGFSRFGQNERSLFSFLFSDEPYSLAQFSNRLVQPGSTYRLPNFYDYIRTNFGHRLSMQSYRSHWTQIESMVESFTTSSAVELAIVKTVGLLNLLDYPDLASTEEAILSCLSGPGGYAMDVLQTAINSLQKDRRVLFRRGISGSLCLWPHTSVDLESAYDRAIKAVGPINTVSRHLHEYLETRPLVARRHYIETGNLRYFEVQYVSADGIASVLEKESTADGQIIVALCETATDCDKAKIIACGAELKTRRDVLVAIPQEPLSNQAGLVAEAMRWDWVASNTPELQSDRFGREEVSRQRQHARDCLANRIKDLIGLRSINGARALHWYSCGLAQKIPTGRQLLVRLSALCDELYPLAPKVKNELLNRHNLSSAAAAARMRLIERMLSRADEMYLGMDARLKPPEMSMYLSVLERGRLHIKKDGCWQFAVPRANNDPLRITPCLAEMRAYIERRPDERIKITDLFRHFSLPPFGVRDGLMPILLSIFAALNVQELAFYEDGTFLRKLGGDELLRLTKRPETFELQICKIVGLRQEVFSSLLRVLDLKKNSEFEPHILDVVKPLCVFVANLPDYVRNTRRLSAGAIAVREAILAAKEPVTFLFKDLPIACGLDAIPVKGPVSRDQARKFAKTLKSILDELRECFEALLDRMRMVIREAFDSDGPFLRVRDTLANRATQVALLANESRLKAFCLRLTDTKLEQGLWLESLGSLLAQQPPMRWKDTDEESFDRELRILAARFKSLESIAFQDTRVNDISEAFRLSLTKSDGSEVQQVIFMDKETIDQVKALAIEIEKLLVENRAVGLAALSRVVWSTLNKD
jgi:hypothetical protein